MDIPIGQPKDMTSMKEQTTPPPPPEVKEQKVPDTPKEPPKKKEKKPWTKKKKITAIAIVVVVLLSFIIPGILYNMPATVEGIDIVIPGDGKVVENDELFLPLTVSVRTSSLSTAKGDATYTIKYKDEGAVTEGKIEIKDNFGAKNILFREFVKENGDYLIIVRFEGKSAEIEYKVNSVIEDCIISFHYMEGSEKPLRLKLTFLGMNISGVREAILPKESVEITITHEDGEVYSGNEKINKTPYEINMSYEKGKGGKGSGYYYAEVKVENKNTLSDSPYRDKTFNKTHFQNLNPKSTIKAIHVDNGVEIKNGDKVSKSTLPNINKADVKTEIRDSWDDGAIVKYRWRVVDLDNQKVIHDENRTNSEPFTYSFTENGDYEILLTVYDEYNAENFLVEPIRNDDENIYIYGSLVKFGVIN